MCLRGRRRITFDFWLYNPAEVLQWWPFNMCLSDFLRNAQGCAKRTEPRTIERHSNCRSFVEFFASRTAEDANVYSWTFVVYYEQVRRSSKGCCLIKNMQSDVLKKLLRNWKLFWCKPNWNVWKVPSLMVFQNSRRQLCMTHWLNCIMIPQW